MPTSLASAIDSIVESGIPAAGKKFGSALDVEWIDEALEQTGTMSVRRRRLSARLVVWLVIAMAFFRDCSIRTVAIMARLWEFPRRNTDENTGTVGIRPTPPFLPRISFQITGQGI